MIISKPSDEVRKGLVEVGGRMSQDLGLGRIVGQILVYLYLREEEGSLEQIGKDLGLSKASVSVAARQLENLGLVRRSWKQGDRRSYYRTADNIATALQQGFLTFLGQKIQTLAAELERARETLERARGTDSEDHDLNFVHSRVQRAMVLRDTLVGLMRNPILKFLTGA